MAKTIEIGERITVGSLAELLMIPASQLISELFKNGVAVTVNEAVDFDTAQIIVGELDLDVELTRAPQQVAEKSKRTNEGESRPPVVAVMGHVDHGKTSLLDAVRGSSMAQKEAGGITQHISAYQVKHNGRILTLLDTPGHESFAALRQHGARLTDVAVIVIAADEGIKPQTLEAIRFAQAAGVKMVVAANKMDRATEVQLNQLKAQLAENGLAPEGFGGDTIVVPVSAKTKEGIDKLLDMILLVADIEELRAPAKGPASGVIIEAHMEQGRGPMATALVEQGVLSQGDFVTAGATYGKVRNLESADGEKLKSAGPSTPVTITGFKALPDFADEFNAEKSEKTAKAKAENAASSRRAGATAASSSSELLRMISRSSKLQELNVIIKADVQGSLTSIADSLKTLSTDEVAARVVGSGVGVITENDIHLASTTGAIIYGFHVELPSHISKLAQNHGVKVRLYTVIYELIDDVKKELEALLAPEVTEEILGEVDVKGVFKITRGETIAGGEVKKGKATIPALARVFRGKALLAEDVEVGSLQRGQQDVKEVIAGEMCGFSLNSKSRLVIEEGDKVEFYTRQTKSRSL